MKRYASTSSTSIPITPAEAGRRAQKLLLQEKVTSATTSTTTSIDTILSHSGFVPYDNYDHPPNDNEDDPNHKSGSPNRPMKKPFPQNSSIAPPIHMSTTFIRPVDGNYNEQHDAIYIRDGNPTRLLFEQQMSVLDLTSSSSSSSNSSNTTNHNHNYTLLDDNPKSYSFAMSSGMMAISSVILAHTLPIHILIPMDLYHGVPTMMENALIPFCTTKMLSYERVDMRDPTQDLTTTLQRLAKEEEEDTTTTTNPKRNIIVWIETPSNPLCHIIDLAHTCHVIRSLRPPTHHDTTTTIVVDSTLAPPIITQPLLIQPTKDPTTSSSTTTNSTSQDTTVDPCLDGVDVVIHSGTKYIGGHSDTMGGIITVSPWTLQGRSLYPRFQELQTHQGGILSSMDSYLMIRGLRTLNVRVERQSQSALILAKYFQDQMYGPCASFIIGVYYPGLPPNANLANLSEEQQQLQQQQQQQQQYELASIQMKNGLYGSILSVVFATESQAMAFIGGLQLLLRATSFGGTETVIEHRASIEPITLRTSPDGLVRISVGLENVHDLLYDIQNAIRIMKIVCSIP